MKRKGIICVLAALIAMLSLFGCSSQKYSIDYRGAQGYFINAKDAYRAGARVKLEAPDSDESSLTLFVDGKEIKPTGKSKNGHLAYEFEMPDHDAVVTFDAGTSKSLYEPVKYLEYKEELGESIYIITMNSYGDYEAVLDVYLKEAANGTESRHQYKIPADAIQKINSVIYEYSMRSWGTGGKTNAFDDRTASCTFYVEDKVFVADSFNAPEGKPQALQKMKFVLSTYVNGKYQIS